MGFVPVPVTLVLALAAFVVLARIGARLVLSLAGAFVVFVIGSQWFAHDRFSMLGRISLWWLVPIVWFTIMGMALVRFSGRAAVRATGLGLLLAALLSFGTGVAMANASGCPKGQHSRLGVCVGDKVASGLQAGIKRERQKVAPKSTEASVLADIHDALGSAQANGMHSGPETSGGVDCVDGCVFFNGLKHGSADEAFQDFHQKLALSPNAAEYGAKYVKSLYGQPYNVKTTGDQRHLDNLKILFGFFAGSTKELKTMPKGAKVTNSVQKNGTIIQFPYTLPKDRQYLSITKHGHEMIVFTTCGNGVSMQPIPGVPTSSKPGPQREFHRTPVTTPPVTTPPGTPPPTVKCAPGTGAPNGSPCADPNGPQRQMQPSTQGPTPGYTSGSGPDNNQTQKTSNPGGNTGGTSSDQKTGSGTNSGSPSGSPAGGDGTGDSSGSKTDTSGGGQQNPDPGPPTQGDPNGGDPSNGGK